MSKKNHKQISYVSGILEFLKILTNFKMSYFLRMYKIFKFQGSKNFQNSLLPSSFQANQPPTSTRL